LVPGRLFPRSGGACPPGTTADNSKEAGKEGRGRRRAVFAGPPNQDPWGGVSDQIRGHFWKGAIDGVRGRVRQFLPWAGSGGIFTWEWIGQGDLGRDGGREGQRPGEHSPRPSPDAVLGDFGRAPPPCGGDVAKTGEAGGEGGGTLVSRRGQGEGGGGSDLGRNGGGPCWVSRVEVMRVGLTGGLAGRDNPNHPKHPPDGKGGVKGA